MTLTPEQKQTVASWVAAGDSLSVIQKKLVSEHQLSLTYMDVRFLVDDLNLSLKDAAPKADASDLSKTQATAPSPQPPEKIPQKKGFFEKAKKKLGLGDDETPAEEANADAVEDDDFVEPEPIPGAAAVKVDVDKVTLLPGAIASGSVTFSDGVTAKWVVDNYGRPGFTEVSKPGYRPSTPDAQAFMQELSQSLQQRGF